MRRGQKRKEEGEGREEGWIDKKKKPKEKGGK